MRPPTDHPAFCRVTLLSPRRRVDVALPTDVPLAELVPLVLELIGEPRRPHTPVPWRFAGPTGGPLPPGATLEGLGVVDGELLRIGPHAPAPTPPVFDDPVDALAATAGPGGAVGARLRAAIAVGAAVLTAAVLALTPLVAAAVAAATDSTTMVLTVLLAVTGTAVCLGQAGGRGAGPAPVTAAVCAAVFAAAGGWAAVPGVPGSGQLLAAAAAAGTAAAIGQVLVRVVAPALVAIVGAAVVLVGVAVVRLWAEVPVLSLAAGAGALALGVGPLLPRVALRLAGLPRPAVPTTAEELAGDQLDQLSPAELAERADLARGFLAGLVAGAAAVVAGAAVVVAAAGSWTGPVLAGVLVAVLGLRTRGYADPAPARASLLAALVGAAGVAAVLAFGGGPVVRLVVAAATGAAALAAVFAAGRAEPITSPVSRRAVDLVEGALMAAAIPLALGVMGIYTLVRGL